MAVLFIISNLWILWQIVTNDSNNISDVVFRQTPMSHKERIIWYSGGAGIFLKK